MANKKAKSTRIEDPSVRVLFRYRDLVALTLKEHREILEASGSCWWGWWKRPSEKGRDEVWKYLQGEIDARGGVDVGLFHSGTGEVHRARVDRIVPPEPDDQGGFRPIELPADEKLKVPSYYRERTFSRAWLRLTTINKMPVHFFHEYSIAEPPPLPQYTEAILARLKNRRINRAADLTGMDTTIWQVRPKLEGDPEGDFYAAAPSVTAPVDGLPIHAPGNLILHLTDPHFATGPHRSQHVWRLESETDDGRPTLADAVMTAIDARNDGKIGVIVVSGDLTYSSSTEEFAEARRSLGKLLGRFNLGPEHVVIVPGNHDIRWDSNKSRYKKAAVVNPIPPEARLEYETFYSDFFGHPQTVHLAMGRRYVFPHGGLVEVCALNSNTLATGPDFLAGVGKIEERAFRVVVEKLGWRERPRRQGAAGGASLAVRLLVLHHHLVPTEDFEREEEFNRGFGMALDAPRIQRLAARFGVQLALHGHKHRAFVWRSGVYELPEHAKDRADLGELSIVGGGSAGSSEVEADKNYFNLITIDAAGVQLDILSSQRTSSFTKLPSWQADFALKPEGLTMGPWKVVSS